MPPSAPSRSPNSAALATACRTSVVALLAWLAYFRAQTWPLYVRTSAESLDPWDGPDKVSHVAAGLLASALMMTLARDFLGIHDRRRWAWPLARTVLLGALKEGYDWLTHADVSARDVAATAVGGVVGIVVVAVATLFVPVAAPVGLPAHAERTQPPRQ
ncbi:MAG: hypothetical protein ACHREM_20845 [Polyangiales bacterium]